VFVLVVTSGDEAVTDADDVTLRGVGVVEEEGEGTDWWWTCVWC